MYNVYNPKATISSIVSYDIEEIIGEFKSFLLLEKISPGSIRSYLSDVRHFFGWLEFFLKSNHVEVKSWKAEAGQRSEKLNTKISPPTSSSSFQLPTSNFPLLLKHVNQEVLDAYKNYLISNNTPQKTINRRFSSLRKFGAFSQDQGWLKENTFDTLKNIPEVEKPFPESEHHLEEFKVHLWKNNLSKATLKNYLNDIKQFLSWTDLHGFQTDSHRSATIPACRQAGARNQRKS